MNIRCTHTHMLAQTQRTKLEWETFIKRVYRFIYAFLATCRTEVMNVSAVMSSLIIGGKEKVCSIWAICVEGIYGSSEYSKLLKISQFSSAISWNAKYKINCDHQINNFSLAKPPPQSIL